MGKLMNYNRTVATLFLVRPLGLCNKNESLNSNDSNYAKVMKKHGFKEAFLKDENHDSSGHKAVYCLFKPPSLQEFNDFIETEIEEGAIILDEYDLPGGFVVLVYKFPEMYENDYDLILQGKYSRTSKDFKSLFPIVKNKTQITLYSIVFFKAEQGVKAIEDELGISLGPDDELWHVPDMKRETLSEDKLKNYDK